MVPVGFNPDDPGGEPHRTPGPYGFESREPDHLPGTYALAGRAPGVEAAGESIQPGVVGLLGVLRPPRSDLVLACVPLPAQPRQRPAQ